MVRRFIDWLTREWTGICHTCKGELQLDYMATMQYYCPHCESNLHKQLEVEKQHERHKGI